MIALTWAMGETVLFAATWAALLAVTVTVSIRRHRHRARDPLEHLRALQRLDARRAR